MSSLLSAARRAEIRTRVANAMADYDHWDDLIDRVVAAIQPDLAEVEQLRALLERTSKHRDYLQERLRNAQQEAAGRKEHGNRLRAERDHLRERLAETDQGAVILALEETVAAADAERDRLEADRDRLRDERNRRDRKLAEAQAELERLRPELETVRERLTEESAGLAVAWQAAKDHKAEKDRLAEQVQALSLVKVWRNEDGKKFIFVDDLLPILHPGEGASEQ